MSLTIGDRWRHDQVHALIGQTGRGGTMCRPAAAFSSARRLVAASMALWCWVPAASAAQELAPGAGYDPAIPTLEATIGHDHGDEITTPEQVARYLDALATAAPDRMALFEYARSWEDRPLYLCVIASPKRIARLDELTADLRRLSDPGALAADELERLIATVTLFA